jgi:diguanylate cyclase (GGDEF)-like protein/PAS domain S-box-containing protein
LDGVIQSWNHGAKKLYGYTKGEVINGSGSVLIPPERIDEGPILRGQIIKGEVVDRYETVRRKKDGTLVDVALTMSPIKHNGEITGASVIARDISERKKAEKLLLHLSTIDELTGLANRRAFDAFLDEEWRRALRTRLFISLMMIDVDFFKKYNDNYGHLKGDACLKLVAEVLEDVARRPGDKVARFGGEEFVVVLSMTDKQHAVSIAEKIRMEVEALKILHVKSRINNYVTVSIGVATVLPEQNRPYVELIKSADEALYKAKEKGRNRVVFNDNIH